MNMQRKIVLQLRGMAAYYSFGINALPWALHTGGSETPGDHLPPGPAYIPALCSRKQASMMRKLMRTSAQA